MRLIKFYKQGIANNTAVCPAASLYLAVAFLRVVMPNGYT